MPTPRITTFNLGVQHELLSGTILHVNYVGTLGDNLTRNVNINQLRAGTRLNPPASTANVNALRPYPGYGNIIITENADESNYHSLQTSLTRRLQSGLEFGVNYTFSKALDTSSGTPEDPYNIARDYGLSAVHRAHNFNGYFIWQIPFLREAVEPDRARRARRMGHQRRDRLSERRALHRERAGRRGPHRREHDRARR